MAYTATSSPATRTVWTPSSPSLTTWWSQGVRMAMRGLSIFIHTGLSYAVLLFIWWEINHLVHQDLQTEIIWLNVLIPILIALVNYCPLFRFLGCYWPWWGRIPHIETGYEHYWGDSCQCQPSQQVGSCCMSSTQLLISTWLVPCGHKFAAIAMGSLSPPWLSSVPWRCRRVPTCPVYNICFGIMI